MDKGRRDVAVKILYNDEALKGFRGGSASPAGSRARTSCSTRAAI
jgi:hypothetical protein